MHFASMFGMFLRLKPILVAIPYRILYCFRVILPLDSSQIYYFFLIHDVFFASEPSAIAE